MSIIKTYVTMILKTMPDTKTQAYEVSNIYIIPETTVTKYR
jgi:hypothetical protein